MNEQYLQALSLYQRLVKFLTLHKGELNQRVSPIYVPCSIFESVMQEVKVCHTTDMYDPRYVAITVKTRR